MMLIYIPDTSHTTVAIYYVYKHHTAVDHHIIPLMMEVKRVPKILDCCPELTWLAAQQGFIKFCHFGSCKSHMFLDSWLDTLDKGPVLHRASTYKNSTAQKDEDKIHA
jgi:hypothetical protein